MSYLLNSQQLDALLPGNINAESWLEPLNTILPTVGIDNEHRIAAFMAQCGHESADFTKLHEVLNYNAAGLMATWPSRFDGPTAIEYAHQSEKIGNKVYANRLGNGDEKSGDGWKFRGRGLIQVTGKSNYAACSKAIFGDYRLLDDPTVVETDKETAIKSAAWFWNLNDLSALADNGYIREMTKKINGGYLGIEDRISRYTAAKTILGIA